jgi:hypothetical protein
VNEADALMQGYDDDPDDWDEEADCWMCGGDGWGIVGVDWDTFDPLWDEAGEVRRCPNCRGSGRAKDCWYW